MDFHSLKIFVEKIYEHFGETRKQEIIRLVYEIGKKEKKDFQIILKELSTVSTKYDDLKSFLIQRRFPESSLDSRRNKFPLGKLDLNPQNKVILHSVKINPNNIYIEESVKQTNLAKRIQKMFGGAQCRIISTYKEFVKSFDYRLKDYNDRLNHFFIIHEKYDFFKTCPCSPHSVSCGYHIVNLGAGCAYECTYCYLPSYLNSPGIVLPANIEDFFDEFIHYKQNIRIGSGEYTDSLVFDHITEYSPQIVEFFRSYPKSMFEFKTKSTNIDLLLKTESIGNIVVAWSVNPKEICSSVEFLTPSIEERVNAAQKCVQAGYKVAFHFDPIIYYKEWERDYADLVNNIFDLIPAQSIAWISLGTLRMTPKLKHTIENRFPENTILDEELILGYDQKIRYIDSKRMEIYQAVNGWIKMRSQKVYTYLCMEDKAACSQCSILPQEVNSS